MLQEICQTNPSKITNQINRLANALILKASGRVVKKAEAGLIFAEIVKEEVLREEITILAIKNSCDLLFQEFRDSGSI